MNHLDLKATRVEKVEFALSKTHSHLGAFRNSAESCRFHDGRQRSVANLQRNDRTRPELTGIRSPPAKVNAP